MSLTSKLDERQGPVRIFIDRCFVADLGEVRKGLSAPVRERLKTVLVPSPLRGGGLGTVGTAFDYRVRYYFQTLPERPFTAHLGAAALCGDWWEVRLKDGRVVEPPTFPVLRPSRPYVTVALMREFFAELDSFLERCTPCGRSLSGKEEQILARYCLVLALFEEVLRAGRSMYFDSPLYHVPAGASIQTLLALPSVEQVADVSALWAGMLKEGVLEGKSAVCNPVFAGSADIGGADADLILDGCLLDLKTTSNPKLAELLRQLLSYVLLDYDDSYSIREVGVYLARHRCLLTFSLHELLMEHVSSVNGLSVTSIYDGEEASLQERLARLRADFRTLLKSQS